jgi:4-carboxymuconolactone decarboxylase
MEQAFGISKEGRAKSRTDTARFLVNLAGACLAVFFVFISLASAEEKMTSKQSNERYDRGLAALKGVNAEAAQGVLDGLKDMSPEMARFIIEFAYGDVFSRPGLDPKSRQVATVAALTALGSAQPQLKFHIGAALNIGITAEEVIEVMYVTTVFAGFPAGLNGISVAREVFKAKGVSINREKLPGPAAGSRTDRGLVALNATSRDAGERVVKSLADIAPEMAQFIIDFSYGDIISRTILSPKHKEIAMIAVCVARGTMEPQMKVHIRAALNVGCTKQEIVELMDHMAVYAGFPAALNGISAARQAFKEHDEISTK